MRRRWEPKAYQVAGVRWLLTHPHGALLWEPGLGKTSTVSKAFDTVRRKFGAKALVVAPRRVCYEVWSTNGELGAWADFADLRVSLLHGPDKEDALEVDADLYVINYEALPWLTSGGRLRGLLRRGVNALVADELSKLKNTQVARFRALRPWLGYFRWRWGLTGTPAGNGLIDVFGQAYVIDRGQALGQYVTHYRQAYFVPSGFGGHDWTLQEGAEERIYKRLRPIAQALRAVDHLDLPPLVERDVYVALPAKVRATYNQLEEELFARLERHEVVAANAAVASGKCRQVASGGVYVEREEPGSAKSTREVVHLHDAKTEALRDLVDELQGAPILVCYEFEHDLARIRAEFGDDVPVIGGRTSDKKVSALIAAWNAGELPMLCGHPASMGHGLNLQHGGSHLCWYTLPWSQELYDQATRRIYRQGVKAPRVVAHRLIARDTVDELVAQALASKTATQDALMKALRARGARSGRTVSGVLRDLGLS